MKNKIKYILLLLTCLFLTGCNFYYLDYNTIDCSLDKSSYRTDEKIVLSCEGCFAENNFQGDLRILFFINQIESDDTRKGGFPIKVEDGGNLKYDSNVKNYFSADILENTNFREVNEKITLNISDYEAGEYELNVNLISHINQAPFEQMKTFCLKFVVTKE